jgi:hypothetical protein
MPDDPNARYEEILRRLQERQTREAAVPQQDALATALDSLGALGALEQVKKRRPPALRVYGPKPFSGLLPVMWSGVCVWYKPKGYFHYETLGILGVWLLRRGEGIEVRVGVKTLLFSAPVFNPESYYHHIRRKFDLFYTGDASPPEAASCLWAAPYAPQERLSQREALAAALATWRESFTPKDS